MDIIVTTPKTESQVAREESCEEVMEDPESFWFRSCPYRPKVELGISKMFFTENGIITGYSIIYDVFQTKDGYMICDTTGREWKGKYFIKHRNWTWLDEKIKYPGFRGLRYVQKSSELIKLLKKWLKPRIDLYSNKPMGEESILVCDFCYDVSKKVLGTKWGGKRICRDCYNEGRHHIIE